MPDLPIACTLAPDRRTARLALIDGLAADALLERTETGAGVHLLLRDTPEIERRVRELVAAESECCPFLDLRLGRAGGALVLDITGPADARPVIDEFFAGEPR
jgi:hypothetical protein